LKLTTCLFLFFSCALSATDYRPWTKVDVQLYPRIDYTFQHYDKINSSSGSRHRSSNDHILGFGLYGNYIEYSLELEGSLARTRDLPCGLNHFKLTGKYQAANDIIGDSLSVTIGGSLIAASRDAVEDYGLFHHSKCEGELFASIGKEVSCYDQWISRWWIVGGIGFGERGSTWMFSQCSWEKNVSFYWQWRLFANLLWGFGGNSINFDRSFKGYGRIRHRSVDIGTGLYLPTLCRGDYSIEFIQRVWARNYPEGAQIVQMSYIYPFGL
jgi:hypothetical protein